MKEENARNRQKADLQVSSLWFHVQLDVPLRCGGRPMKFRVAVIFKMSSIPLIDIPIPKFGILVQGEQITLGRLATALMPKPFDNPFNPDTTLTGDVAKALGIDDGSLDWIADTEKFLEDTMKRAIEGVMVVWRFILDAIRCLKLTISINTWIAPMRLESTGTVIPSGIYVDVQNLHVLGLFTIRRAMIQFQVGRWGGVYARLNYNLQCLRVSSTS
jgi:hypothetical protein